MSLTHEPGGLTSEVRIKRTFVWRDGRPDDQDEILFYSVDHRVTHDGVPFALRRWDLRYRAGEQRVTEAVYDEESESSPALAKAEPEDHTSL